MEKTKSLLIKTIVFIINLIILIGLILLFVNKIIIPEVFLALIFLQALVCSISLFIYYIYKRIQHLAHILGFKYIRGTFPHPKFEGKYKNNWWQLHFISKETGSQWGLPLTYLKLQWKEPKKFADSILLKYKNHQYKGNRIISVTHLTRDYKNYLLLKRAWFTFDLKKINEIMDLLVKIASEAEIKKHNK